MKSNSPYSDEKLDEIPAGIPAAIQHVLYIVKENRTYDQVLGDIGKGESDPSLCLFKENVEPQSSQAGARICAVRQLLRQWRRERRRAQLVDVRHRERFCGRRLWPSNYGRRNPNYDFEGGEPAAYPPAGYLWTNAASAGVSMRNYGYWVENKEEPGPDGVQIDKVLDPVLAKVTNMKYRSFDLDYPDVKRAQVFLDDLAQFESTNQMPALMFMRLGNDHTSATAPGKIAPLSSFADNDYALGMIVEGAVAQQVLGQHGDLRAGRRRAKRAGSRGFAPLARIRHFALHAPRNDRQHHVQHHVHAAHHGADPASASHDAFRRRRAAHVRRIRAASRPRRRIRPRSRAFRWTSAIRRIRPRRPVPRGSISVKRI